MLTVSDYLPQNNEGNLDGLAPLIGDDDLWQRTRTGDADAFGELFLRHSKAIYNYCYRQTGDWPAAEDLTSVVFLEVWRRKDAAIEPGMLRAWLFGVATNVVRNQRRSQRRHAAALARLPKEITDERFEEASDQMVDDRRAAVKAVEALSRLPRRERDVFVLCAWSGLQYEEAAAALRIPVGTVRSRFSRAKSRLRELVEPSGHEQSEGHLTETTGEGQ